MPSLSKFGQFINNGVCNVFNTLHVEVGEAIGNVRRRARLSDRRSETVKALDAAYKRRLETTKVSVGSSDRGEYAFPAGRGDRSKPSDTVIDANYRVIENDTQEAT